VAQEQVGGGIDDGIIKIRARNIKNKNDSGKLVMIRAAKRGCNDKEDKTCWLSRDIYAKLVSLKAKSPGRNMGLIWPERAQFARALYEKQL
jgi:hypothetical protein